MSKRSYVGPTQPRLVIEIPQPPSPAVGVGNPCVTAVPVLHTCWLSPQGPNDEIVMGSRGQGPERKIGVHRLINWGRRFYEPRCNLASNPPIVLAGSMSEMIQRCGKAIRQPSRKEEETPSTNAQGHEAVYEIANPHLPQPRSSPRKSTVICWPTE